MSLRRSNASILALLLALPLPAAAAEREVRHPEDLFVVDCLLPAKVRSLGRYNKVAAPRKIVRVSAHECQLRAGEYSQDPRDNEYALQAWLGLAGGGDAEAMNNVGELYEQGVRGVPDLAAAAKWYRQAAEAGDRRAQTNLGALYEQGLGVERDESQALAWYRRAAGMTGTVDLDAQKEIDSLKAELARTRAEAESARSEIARVTGELAGARSELAGAERRVAELRQEAARATASATASTPAAPASPPPVTVAAVLEAERAVEARQHQVAELEAAQDRYRRMLGELEASARSGEQVASLRASDLVGKAGPTIQFVRPDVLATRGPSIATLPADAAEAEIVGRVAAPLGLASLLADGKAVTADADGYFRVRVPVRPGGIVRFVALDRASRRAEAELQFAQAGARPVTGAPTTPAATTATRGRRAFALVVANSAYRSLPALTTARADGEAVARVLGDRYGYETRLLSDATFLDTLQALTDIGGRLKADDDLLVYFAGHGRMEEGGKRGYWLPVDAAPEDRSTWIPNEAIAKLLGTFAASRILVVSDSCYAGTFASSGVDLAAAPRAAGAPRSRLVLTSGGLQPVLDQGGDGTHSIFARALLSVLQLAERPMSAGEVFSAVAARVSWKAGQLGLDQTPELAPIRYAGHETGEYVLAPSGPRRG